MWYHQRLTIPSNLPSGVQETVVAIIMEERCPFSYLCAYLKQHEHLYRTKKQTKALIRIIKEMILEAYDISTKIVSDSFISSYIVNAKHFNQAKNDAKAEASTVAITLSSGEPPKSVQSEEAPTVSSASQAQLDRLTSCLTTMAEQQVSAQQQQMSINVDSQKMIHKLSEGQQKLSEGQQKLSEGLVNVNNKVDNLGFTQDAQGKFINDLNNRMKKLQNQVDSQQNQIDSKLDSDDFFEYAEANDAVIAERSDEDDDDNEGEDGNKKFAPRSLFATGGADTSIVKIQTQRPVGTSTSTSTSTATSGAASFGSINSRKPTVTAASFGSISSAPSSMSSSTSAPAAKYKPLPVPSGKPDFGKTSTFMLGSAPKVIFGQPPAAAQAATNTNPFTFGYDPDSTSSAITNNFGTDVLTKTTAERVRSTRGKRTYSLAEFSKNRSKVASCTTAASVGYGGGGSSNTSDRRKGKRSSSDLPSDDDDDDYNRSSTGHQKTHRKNQS